MSRQLTILGLGGSTRKDSSAEVLLCKALLKAQEAGMRTDRYLLATNDLPVFKESLLATPPPAVGELLDKVRQADAFIFCSPVYHGTISGAFKNAIDYFQALAVEGRPWLTGKAAGLMAVGGTPMGGANAISAMDHFCRALRATTVPTAVIAGQGFLEEGGTIVNEAVAQHMVRMIQELGSQAWIGANPYVRLVRADGLPGIDGLVEDRVDRLGEGGAGLVGRNVEEADRVAGQYLL